MLSRAKRVHFRAHQSISNIYLKAGEPIDPNHNNQGSFFFFSFYFTTRSIVKWFGVPMMAPV